MAKKSVNEIDAKVLEIAKFLNIEEILNKKYTKYLGTTTTCGSGEQSFMNRR